MNPNAVPFTRLDKVKIAGTVVAAVVLTTYAFNVPMYDESDDATDYYPACAEIVSQPGTYRDAGCISEGDLIEVHNDPDWDRLHPWE